ncbi:MAG: hypothetical protein HQ495_06730 [Alphaproteobacteria bacterium]|nr:hypothetical protein [Alphaproteobacteria bacterium]
MARFLALGSAVFFVFAVAACDGQTARSGKIDKDGVPAAGPASVPANAIAIGDDLYMVPQGRDADGCEMYQAFSTTMAVAQVIQYRTRDGGYVMDKRDSVCGP